jgi:lysozyme-like protein
VGDIWLPGLGPKYTTFDECFAELALHMPSRATAVILAAIAGPESGYDYSVINDTPATGDYSVGLWQINYYQSLYDQRVRQFGTPRQLIEGGVKKQAKAAATIYDEQGFQAWATTYNSGDWRKYIGGGGNPGPFGPGGRENIPSPKPGRRDDWSGHVRRTSAQFGNTSHALDRYARGIHRITREAG